MVGVFFVLWFKSAMSSTIWKFFRKTDSRNPDISYSLKLRFHNRGAAHWTYEKIADAEKRYCSVAAIIADGSVFYSVLNNNIHVIMRVSYYLQIIKEMTGFQSTFMLETPLFVDSACNFHFSPMRHSCMEGTKHCASDEERTLRLLLIFLTASIFLSVWLLNNWTVNTPSRTFVQTFIQWVIKTYFFPFKLSLDGAAISSFTDDIDCRDHLFTIFRQ